MNVTFYTFSKRKNSTARPSSGGTDVDCKLKDDTSLLNPILEVRTPPALAWNYAYIPTFARYYFVGEMSYYRGVWSITLAVDPLASWREQIRNTRCHVLYSSSSYNLDLIDGRVVGAGHYIRDSRTSAFNGAKAGANVTPKGTFAVSCLSNGSSWQTGAATTYYMTYQQMQSFANAIQNADLWEQLKQWFTNPLDGIIECYYIPLSPDSYLDLSSDIGIRIGDYDVPGVTGRACLSTDMAIRTQRTTIEIPWNYSDFRRLSPYTDITLFVPFCGSKSLDPAALYNVEQFFIDYSVDFTSGSVQAIAYIKEMVLEEFSGNIKITLPIAQTQARVPEVLGAVGGIVDFATGRPAAGVANVVNAVVSQASHKVMGGMSGSVLGAILGNDLMRWQEFRCTCTSRETNTSPADIRATIGNVLDDVISLNAESGYIQTEGFSVDAPAFDSELEAINTMMDGGVYLQ